MADTNKELLDELIGNRAEMAMDPNLSDDERKTAYEDVMKAYDRSIKLEEIEAANKQAKKNRIIKWVEVGVGVAVPIVLLVIKEISTRHFGREVMRFEKDDRFSYTPGQSRVSSYFRHKD